MMMQIRQLDLSIDIQGMPEHIQSDSWLRECVVMGARV